MFEFGLGPVALAFTAASTKQDHALMDEALAAHGANEFADRWLRAKGLDWAADLIAAKNQPLDHPDKEDAHET